MQFSQASLKIIAGLVLRNYVLYLIYEPLCRNIMNFYHICLHMTQQGVVLRFSVSVVSVVGGKGSWKWREPIIESSSNLVWTNHKTLLLNIFSAKKTVVCLCPAFPPHCLNPWCPMFWLVLYVLASAYNNTLEVAGCHGPNIDGRWNRWDHCHTPLIKHVGK